MGISSAVYGGGGRALRIAVSARFEPAAQSEIKSVAPLAKALTFPSGRP